MNRFMSIVVAVVAIVAISAPVAAADQRPIVLEFHKTGSAGQYSGTIQGGGTIQMQLFDAREAGNTQHFSAYVLVVTPSTGLLTAVVSGQMNMSTGKVFLNGTVTGGLYEGAQVQEESQLDWGSGAFDGTIRIMPAS